MTRFAKGALIIAALAGPAAADTAPPPPAPPPTVEVQIEITDAGAAAASFTGTLAIAGGECGELEATAISGHYRVRACFDTKRGAPFLSLDLDREVGRGKDDVHQKVQTIARVDSGKRVVLGRFGQGNDTTE